MQQQSPILAIDLPADPADADLVLDLGEALLGETVSRRVRLENVGAAELAVQVDHPRGPFRADLPGKLSSIEVGGSAEVRFSFLPLGEESADFDEVIEMRTNEGKGGKRYRLRLLGRGVRATLDCVPEGLAFGTARQGATALRTVQCSNPLSREVEASLRIAPASQATFAATPSGGAADPVRIGAGETLEIEVELRAQSVGNQLATVELVGRVGEILAAIPVSASVLSSLVSVEPQPCLDFRYVGLGTTATKELTLVNRGDEAVTIPRIALKEESAQDFSVLTGAPIRLEAQGGTASVEVAFHPQESGSHDSALQLWIDDETSPISACLRGFGGGPSLACSPARRDLGPVGIGLPAITRFECANVGVAPEGAVIDPLLVKSIGADDAAFTPTIRHQDGTVGPRSRGYRLGEGFLVEVAYSPLAEEFDEGRVLVETNVNDVELRIAGEGRAVEPCVFSINPPWVRYGVVPRDEARRVEIEIKNHGATACIVHDLRLAEDTSPAFSMEPIAVTEIEAGGSLRVPVTFSPQVHGASFLGKVLFEISHPTERYQAVELSGASANACLLIEPMDLDFGSAAPGCRQVRREVKVSNVCSTPLEITSIDVGASPDQEDFSVVQRPPMPLRLEPQDYADVLVAFEPQELGRQQATLVLELTESVQAKDHAYVASLHGEGSSSARQTDEFQPPARPQIDILWVIDNSTSMLPYQQALQENLPAFMTMANLRNVDFHIGVTTTALQFGGEGCPGGADGGEDGRLFPVDGSHPRILTSDTPDLETHWRHNMAVGNCFDLWAESPLEAAYRALSPPLINSAKDIRYSSPYMDGNLGFLRPGAFLSVILVSDGRDFSLQDSLAYTTFFLNLKRGQADLVRVHAISGPRSNQTDPHCSAEAGDKMLDVVDATYGTWLDICTSSSDATRWTQAMEKMSEGVFAQSRRHVLRGLPADANGDGKVDELDIEVRLDGKVEPPTRDLLRVWSYDPLTNSVGFEPLFAERPGTRIAVSYDLSCH